MNVSTATSAPLPVTAWEFLLQKAGDRSWLPLDSPSVEILEGRYRVVARSGRPQVHVEIRVTHLATQELPLKRRAQKRPGRTNADGLMVVTPYTVMQPGIWELSCFSDVMADLMGDGWQHSVRLHVLPRDVEATDDWEPDWHQPPTADSASESRQDVLPLPGAEPSIAVPALAANPGLPAADQGSQQIADDVGEEFDAAVAADEVVAAPLSAPTLAKAPAPTGVSDRAASGLRVVLQQESYVIHRGSKLMLTGQVASGSGVGAVELLAVDRVISLRDPQSSQVLLHQREAMPPQSLPAAFACELLLPPALSTRLMLGEMTIHAADCPDQVLASQTFTVVSALNELLEAIADSAAVDRGDLSDESAASSEPTRGLGLDLTFLDAVNLAPPEPAQPYGSIAGQVWPPQLHQPTPTLETGKKLLDLPSFAPIQPRDLPPELRPIARSEPELPPADSSAPELLPHSVPAAAAAPPLAPLQLSAQVPEPQTYPITDEFQALKLQDRFLDRLNALAADVELSENLKDQVPLAERLTAPGHAEGAPLVDREAELLALEVVVDDPAELLSRRATRHQPPVLPHILPPEMLLSADVAVPVPTLTLAPAPLVAGQAVTVQVKIPNLLPCIYVKLWISDRQTRTLLDGPRWLVDFTPDGLGDQTVVTELTVPFGSVEVVIAAIAVEMATQRESYKMTLDLPVIPAEMPASSQLAELE